MADFYIRTSDLEVKRMLKRLAQEDKRSLSMEIAWIVRREYERRFGREVVEVAQDQDTSES